MDVFTRRDLESLLRPETSPCLSVYFPTRHGSSDQGPIRLKNLLREAEQKLTAGAVPPAAGHDLLAAARRLLEDEVFWRSQGDGVALFAAPGTSRAFRLPAAFPELVEVGDHFHVKPLLPLVDGDGRFYVLALSQKRARLYRGTAHRFEEVSVPAVPQGIEEALRTHDRDEPLVFHTRPTSGGGWAAIFHGHGVGIDDHKDDLLRYFRQVDRGLHEVLHAERAPLVLAAVEALWPIYREANRYPHLLQQGVSGCPDHAGPAELHEKAWAVVGPVFLGPQRKAAAVYDRLAGTGRTTADLEEVLRAAREGRVETLFVARDREQWDESGVGLLNQAAVHVLRHGGAVYAVDPHEVPGRGLASGIYRLPERR